MIALSKVARGVHIGPAGRAALRLLWCCPRMPTGAVAVLLGWLDRQRAIGIAARRNSARFDVARERRLRAPASLGGLSQCEHGAPHNAHGNSGAKGETGENACQGKEYPNDTWGGVGGLTASPPSARAIGAISLL